MVRCWCHHRLRGAAKPLKGRSEKIVLVAFDLLYLDGKDLRQLPLFERKAHLQTLVSRTEIQFSESFVIDGREMLTHACKVGLEGVVSKVRDSRYPDGRSNNWVKTTCAQRETLPIAGFALDGKTWDGIYVGRYKGGDLVYADTMPQAIEVTDAEGRKALYVPLSRGGKVVHSARVVEALKRCGAVERIGRLGQD